MKMMDQEWMDKFEPREYKREGAEEDLTKDNNFGYSPQGVKDLDEVYYFRPRYFSV